MNVNVKCAHSSENIEFPCSLPVGNLIDRTWFDWQKTPHNYLWLFPSQSTDLFNFMPPSCPPLMFLLPAPDCGLWVLRKGRDGLWARRQGLFEATAAYAGLCCLPLTHVFISPPPPSFFSSFISLSLPPTHTLTLTQFCSWLCQGPLCTNDPANYIFKVFGSCENSLGLTVKCGGGGGREEGV